MACEAYTIKWSDDSSESLSAIWMENARIREAVRLADLTAGAILQVQPTRFAEHQSEGLYRLTVAPLVVYFEVDEATCRVFVTGLGLIEYHNDPQ